MFVVGDASVGSDFHVQEGFRNILPGRNRSLPINLANVFPLLGISSSIE